MSLAARAGTFRAALALSIAFSFPRRIARDSRNARAGGAEVLVYLNAVDYPDGTPPPAYRGCTRGAAISRLWSTAADWTSWPQAEKDEYTSGANDLVRRIDTLRRAIDPNFIVVNNNNWDRGSETGRTCKASPTWPIRMATT